MGLQVLAHAGAEYVVADHLLQLAHHDRRLVIDDRAVHLSRLVQVLQILANGIRAVRPVDRIGAWIMAHEKIEVVIDVGESGIDDFGGHEVGKNFFGPDVVEPFHGDEVAEPHVRGFMGNQPGAAQQAGLRWRLVEEQTGKGNIAAYGRIGKNKAQQGAKSSRKQGH